MGGQKPVLLVAHWDFVHARFAKQSELTLRSLQQALGQSGREIELWRGLGLCAGGGLELQKTPPPASRIAPTLPANVIIRNNLGGHKAKAVRKALRAVGAELLFLPPYSPYLKPIE